MPGTIFTCVLFFKAFQYLILLECWDNYITELLAYLFPIYVFIFTRKCKMPNPATILKANIDIVISILPISSKRILNNLGNETVYKPVAIKVAQ